MKAGVNADMAFIGLDIGTSGCKCGIFDAEGGIKAFSYREYEVLNPGEGLFELNPEEVWEAVKYVIKTSAAEFNGERVTAICVSSFGESGVPLDKEGNALCNSFLYTDIRGAEQCRKLVEKNGLAEIMNLTGVHAHPMYTINKVMWIRENMYDIYKRIWKFMLFEDYILYKLGRVAAIDYSLASRTMAFNVTDKVWEKRIFETSGIEPGIFSEAVPSGTVIGTIKDGIAEELGLPKGVQLVTGGHDQVCAAIGGGIISEGMALYGIGTVECITPAFGAPVLNDRMLGNNFACVPHAKDKMYVTYAFNFSGGAILKWYRDNFARSEKAEADAKGENVYDILDRKAAKNPTGILMLPHFAGSGTPRMDTASRGAIIGLGFDTGYPHIYRALLEGITYEMLYNLECLEEAGITVNELRAVGGGAKSDFWLQIKADIMGRKITKLDINEAGTLGTAILAGVATGVYESVEGAVKRLVKTKKEYYANEKNYEIYMENYAKYKKMYDAVKAVIG